MQNDLRLRESIRAGQIRWAMERGLSPDKKGYLANVELNLFRPMAPKTFAEYSQGKGKELQGKMRALHSSSALVCNVFEYWRNGDTRILGEALEVESLIDRVTFEEQFRTGLPGNSPQLDVVLQLRSGSVWGIESKFVEPFESSTSRTDIRKSYFPAGKSLWDKHGLPKCDVLADRIKNGHVTFNYIDAPQLLKHALGLQVNQPDNFTICYVYYDVEDHSETIQHLAETKEFASAIGGDFPLVMLSYKTLVNRLRVLSEETNLEYFEYLGARYGF